MDLLELCEPLFLYVCRLNRSSRKGGNVEVSRVRSEVIGLLEEMRAKAAGDARLTDQFDKVELPLIFFVDFMVKESIPGFAEEWRELAHERNELAGDDKFFELLDMDLEDQSQAASERLAVFATCIGLGFTGSYIGQPELLRKKLLACSARIRPYVDVGEMSRICPEAYENVNTAMLVEPPGTKLLGIGLALVVFIIVLFVANIYLYMVNTDELKNALQSIVKHDVSAAPAPTASPDAAEEAEEEDSSE